MTLSVENYRLNNRVDILKFYQTQAFIYDKVRSPIIDSFEEKIELVKKEGKIAKESKVVEIGVGTGKYLSRIVKDTGCKGIGIDISSEMLSIAEQKNLHNITYIQADAAMMPLESNYCDIVYAVNSIHQVQDIDALFREVFRVLKIGGRFLVTTPDISRLNEFLLYRACQFLLKNEKKRMPTQELLKKYGRRSGFVIENYFVSSANGKTISLEQFLFLIKHRFLTCLASLRDDELEEVIHIMKSFSEVHDISRIPPYIYILIIFLKGGE